MNKQEFTAKLAEQEGIEKKQSAACTDAVIKVLKDAVAQK